MLLQVDYKSGKPVYLQVVDQIRYAIASGALKRDEILPSIRPLAEELRINRNTVAKAYAELESQGVIETRPGKGCFVRHVESPLKKVERERVLIGVIDEAVVTAHHMQIAPRDFLALVKERLEVFARKVEASRKEKEGGKE
jgi:GntR family transcriptional regulator